MLNLQAFMDQVVEVIMRDDLDGYLAMISLPYQVITASETRTFTRRAEMEDHFHLFKAGLDTLGFQSVGHRVMSTTMLGKSLATGIYETRLTRHDSSVLAPYRSCITLRHGGDKWRAVSNAHTFGHADWLERLEHDTALQHKQTKE